LWIFYLSELVARHTKNTGGCASGGLGPSNKVNQAQVGQNSAILAGLILELKHSKQMVLEFTGIFDGKSQELNFDIP
jgi:hypothetical protein